MIRSFIRPATVALLVAGTAMPALASDDEVSDSDKATITAMLTEMGYEVRKIEIDDGELEAYVVKDGANAEVVLEKKFEIVEIKS